MCHLTNLETSSRSRISSKASSRKCKNHKITSTKEKWENCRKRTPISKSCLNKSSNESALSRPKRPSFKNKTLTISSTPGLPLKFRLTKGRERKKRWICIGVILTDLCKINCRKAEDKTAPISNQIQRWRFLTNIIILSSTRCLITSKTHTYWSRCKNFQHKV